MAAARRARSGLLVLVLVFLSALAAVNLIFNLENLEAMESPQGGGVTVPDLAPITVSPPVATALSIGLSIGALGLVAFIYFKYRPKVGRFPFGEMVPILVIILLVLSLAYLNLGINRQTDQNPEDQGTGTGDQGQGPASSDNGGGGPLLPTLNLGPGVLAALMVFFGLSAAIFLLSSLRIRRSPTPIPWELISAEEPRKKVARTIERGIYRLRVGDDVRAAILSCYADMVSLLKGRGVTAGPQMTAREFEDQALHKLSLSPRSSRALRELFELARYSSHPLTEKHRTSGLTSLEAVRRELEA